jgi:glycerol-1-phosphate dehydrogenase [NAD(P)+]
MPGTRTGWLDVQRYATTARPIGLRAARIGTDALFALPDLIATTGSGGPARRIAVLSDATPKKRLGRDVTELVASLAAAAGDVDRVITAADAGGVHADEGTISAAAAACADASVIVTAGSGTVTDIGKAVAARLRPAAHIVVQTALSVNGYADDQSVLLVDGVKRTRPTRWPDALIADTQVLSDAPLALNLAGVGDLLAMFTAPADWQLAHLLGMDPLYSDDVVTMVRPNGPALLRAAPKLRKADPGAIELTATVLTLSGVSMGIAGTTAPASGAEHTVSHLIEMSLTRQGRPGPFHGAQVGVASVLGALVWQHVEAAVRAGRRDLSCPPDAQMQPAVFEAFAGLDTSGAMARECWHDYQLKLSRWRGLHGEESQLDPASLAACARWLADPADLAAALRDGGAPARFAQLDPPVDAGTASWALANCHLMRNRFTVVDLAFLLGIWRPQDVDAILARARSLGAGL